MIIMDLGDMRRYGNHIGSGVGAFKDIDGDDADPTEVLLTVQKPDATEDVYVWPYPSADPSQLELSKEADGRFYADVLHDQSELWKIRLEGTGTVTAAAELIVRVRQSVLT